MAKKRAALAPTAGKTVTLERAARLYRLVQFLDTGAKSRKAILQRLRIDIRTFYRDLELLRDCRVGIALKKQRYSLENGAANALAQLPLPDPGLSLGEARILAKGKSQVHQKLRRLLKEITGGK